MSQPHYLDDIDEDDLPKIPGPHGGLQHAADAAQNAARADRHPHSPHPPSASIPMTALKRTDSQSSGAAHVDIGHFDPEGVANLRRSMTRQSQQVNRTSIAESEATLNVDDGNFDFEKVLRAAMKRRVDRGLYDFVTMLNI
jgi:ATP-binding cassette subfamily G (WHITE) protein 2 (SNQ2)